MWVVEDPGGSFWEGFCCQKASKNSSRRKYLQPRFFVSFSSWKKKKEFETKFIELGSAERTNYFINCKQKPHAVENNIVCVPIRPFHLRHTIPYCSPLVGKLSTFYPSASGSFWWSAVAFHSYGDHSLTLATDPRSWHWSSDLMVQGQARSSPSSPRETITF